MSLVESRHLYDWQGVEVFRPIYHVQLSRTVLRPHGSTA